MVDEGYVQIRLKADGEVSNITDARRGDFPLRRKHKPKVHKGEVIEVRESIAKEAIESGRWVKELVVGNYHDSKMLSETKHKKKQAEKHKKDANGLCESI